MPRLLARLARITTVPPLMALVQVRVFEDAPVEKRSRNRLDLGLPGDCDYATLRVMIRSAMGWGDDQRFICAATDSREQRAPHRLAILDCLDEADAFVRALNNDAGREPAIWVAREGHDFPAYIATTFAEEGGYARLCRALSLLNITDAVWPPMDPRDKRLAWNLCHAGLSYSHERRLAFDLVSDLIGETFRPFSRVCIQTFNCCLDFDRHRHRSLVAGAAAEIPPDSWIERATRHSQWFTDERCARCGPKNKSVVLKEVFLVSRIYERRFGYPPVRVRAAGHRVSSLAILAWLPALARWLHAPFDIDRTLPAPLNAHFRGATQCAFITVPLRRGWQEGTLRPGTILRTDALQRDIVRRPYAKDAASAKAADRMTAKEMKGRDAGVVMAEPAAVALAVALSRRKPLR